MDQVAEKESTAGANGVAVASSAEMIREPLRFDRHVAELNATNHNLLRGYIWGLDLSETLDGAGGVAGLLCVRMATGPAAGTHFVCYDGNGNVWNLVSGSTGTETARYEYGPFGEALRLSGPAAKANPFRFSTKRTEDFSGLVVYEYRAYSPTLGRWLSRDPVGDLGGENLYVYVANDGVSASDSVGLCAAWFRAASAVALPGLKNPLPDIDKDLCAWLEGKIRSFLSSSEDIRAWNRFVSGTGIDIELTESEMGSALVAAPAFQAELKKQAEDCKANPFYWFNRTTQLADTIGPHWSASLGRVTITLTTSCACRTLTWEACIFDKYDFDPTWFLGGREVTAEIKTILVWVADKVSQCGWKACHHKGCKSGFVAN
ncbi:RHS repeat-associated core domain-containing protein [Limisphaera sp. 4302-co]|uniref:RHS repeat-associated core domain-containing protein n=1 Tax=Limisphaera sp. 4302-co TaxID=3400417 RepID=UPI003C2990BA